MVLKTTSNKTDVRKEGGHPPFYPLATTLQSLKKIHTSADENHLCGASLRTSHKISLKAHRHACAHGVGTPIARPEKLPRQ